MTASVLDRLARRPAHRVRTRLAERLGGGFTSRLAAHIRQRLRRCGAEREKRAKKPKQWLDVFTTTNRVWQFLAALVLFGIYSYMVRDGASSSENQAETARREVIERLAPVMLLYHVNVLVVNCLLRKSKCRETRGWRFASVAMLVADLMMMRLNLSKMNALSAAGAMAPCDPPEKSSVFKSMLKNGTAFAYSRLGWADAVEQEEMDLHCCLPKMVYLLCGIAIFSYTFSILFTGLQLQRHWPGNAAPPLLPLHIGEAERSPQVQLVFVPRPSFTAPRPSEAAEPIPEPVTQTQSFRAARQSMSTTRSASEDLPRYTHATNESFSEMPPRSSMETTSSFNPELYLVSDGFRPAPELPIYSSRPPSLRGRPPSYSSRPSSIRNV